MNNFSIAVIIAIFGTTIMMTMTAQVQAAPPKTSFALQNPGGHCVSLPDEGNSGQALHNNVRHGEPGEHLDFKGSC